MHFCNGNMFTERFDKINLGVKAWFFIFLIITPISIAVAQDEDVVGLSELPDETFQIRQNQREFARQQGVEIRTFNQGQRSSTTLDEVPQEIQNATITSARDLENIKELLYPYYGFSGTESLRITGSEQAIGQSIYKLKQYIDDIPTAINLSVHVDNETFQIVELSGGLVMDRGLERDPRYESEEAINLALNYIMESGTLDAYKEDGQHQASLYYRQFGEDAVLRLWWEVLIERRDPILLPDGSEERFDLYYVSPNGDVLSPIELGKRYVSAVEVCDGSSTATSWCSSSQTPTVINTSGVCQPGYNCSGSNNQYQVPYDTVNDVESMWEDIFSPGCCDLETTNTVHSGGIVDINVGGDTNGYAGYYLYYKLPSGYTQSVIVLNPNNADDPTVVAHEIGHAYHAKINDNSYNLGGTYPVGAKREYEAMVESIADIHAVIFQNYNGPSSDPKFDSVPDFVTPSGKDYSQQYDISDISPINDAYENGRVSGHAMYEIIQNQNVDFEVAAKLYYNSIAYLTDDDGDGWITFQEYRDAMLDAATAMGASTSIKNAIKDAWHDVGVGPASGSGGSGTNPPTTTPPGAPNPPSNLNASLYRACHDGKTDYDISFNHVFNATHYNIWHSQGLGWSLTGSTSGSPVLLWTTVDANIKVSSCNVNGCSVLSTDTTTVESLCN